MATGGEKGLQARPLQSSVGISVFSGRTTLVAFEIGSGAVGGP